MDLRQNILEKIARQANFLHFALACWLRVCPRGLFLPVSDKPKFEFCSSQDQHVSALLQASRWQEDLERQSHRELHARHLPHSPSFRTAPASSVPPSSLLPSAARCPSPTPSPSHLRRGTACVRVCHMSDALLSNKTVTTSQAYVLEANSTALRSVLFAGNHLALRSRLVSRNVALATFSKTQTFLAVTPISSSAGSREAPVSLDSEHTKIDIRLQKKMA